jgi:pimeloyl-ACP methyl ester carboxylesterase
VQAWGGTAFGWTDEGCDVLDKVDDSDYGKFAPDHRSRGKQGRIVAATRRSIVVIACLICAAGAVAQAPIESQAYAAPQRLITIDGSRRLNIYCTGTGSPTVVLDAGGGGWSIAWAAVQPLVAARTRACSYDRAGLGFSDPGPMPRTTEAIVGDLHELLHRAGERPPYVLVGHSMGGFDVRLFADRYPDEVAGMVLVDPSSEEQWTRFNEILPRLATIDASYQLPIFRRCAAAARSHELEPGMPAARECVPRDNPAFGSALNATLQQFARRAYTWKTMESELESEDPTDRAELVAAQKSCGAMPVIVLTGGAQFKQFQRLIGLSDSQVIAAQQTWSAMHDSLAACSSHGVNHQVPGTGHDIPRERPQAVADAIFEVIAR